MMSHLGIKMNVVCDTKDLLQKIKENRTKHSAFVKEARIGYVESARKHLEKRLNQLKDNKVVNLSFSLTPPQDYTTVYDTVINMLEMHKEQTITVSASEFRQIAEDEWDWTHTFLASNSKYSSGTRAYAASKGYALGDDSDDVIDAPIGAALGS